MTTKTVDIPFAIGERVSIDADRGIRAVVIGVLVRPSNIEVEVSWLHNGAVVTAWVAAFRLTLTD